MRTRMPMSFRTTRKDRKRTIEKEIYILSGRRPLPGSAISALRGCELEGEAQSLD
jgi:hypothetical protein